MEELAAVTPLNNPILTSGADTESLTGLSGEAPVPVNFSNDTLTGGTSTADTDTRRILEVTGTGEVSVPTSQTQVELGIQVQAQTATEVTEELAQSSTAVVDVLQDLGAQELQTTSIQLNPVYSFEDDVQTLTGFEGRNILEFQLPTDQAGAAIDAAITAGANLVQGISFIASENALQQARKEALTEAVQDAQAQAEVVLSSLQLAPGEIIKIEIGAADISTPSPLLFDRTSAEGLAATTPILGGPQTVDATVSLDILYFPDTADTLAPATGDTLADLSIQYGSSLSPTSLTPGSDISNVSFDSLSSGSNLLETGFLSGLAS